MALFTLSPADTRTAIDAGARLIDVRGADEHARERIGGAVNVPLDRLDTLAHDGNPIIFHCRSGSRTTHHAARLDAAAGDPNHGAVEAVIGDDHVGAAAEQQPVLRLGPCGLHGVEQLGAGRGRDQLRGRAADPEGGQRGELGHVGGHAGRATTAWALPSTVWPLQLTVRSMRTPASSRAPTLALTLTTAPVSGSTTTGRVKRT